MSSRLSTNMFLRTLPFIWICNITIGKYISANRPVRRTGHLSSEWIMMLLSTNFLFILVAELIINLNDEFFKEKKKLKMMKINEGCMKMKMMEEDE